MKYVTTYLLNLLRWIDCGVNTLILFGSPYETISERSAKARNAGQKWGCVMCAFLDWVRKDHCNRALQIQIGDDAIIPDPVNEEGPNHLPR